jgi:hypothetical protein
MAIANFDETYEVKLTGREIYWLIRLANAELIRLQELPDEENPLKNKDRWQRYVPIKAAFEKLIVVGQG